MFFGYNAEVSSKNDGFIGVVQELESEEALSHIFLLQMPLEQVRFDNKHLLLLLLMLLANVFCLILT